MDPAEEIVGLWLQQQGFFIRYGTKVGYQGKEIDFLGVDSGAQRRVHVEVHASVYPLGPLRPWSPARYGKMSLKERVKHYYNYKFVGSIVKDSGRLINRCVENAATKAFGSADYEKWLVLAELHRKDSETELRNELAKYNVILYLLKEILREVRFKGAAKDRTGRFIQLLAAQLTDEAKKSLLKR